jgi:hypothetical protein
MRIRTMASTLTALALLVLVAPQASAQTGTRPAPASKGSSGGADDGLNVAVAYSFWHFSEGNYPVGLYVDASKTLSHGSKNPLAVVGEFGLHHASGDTATTFMGGARMGFGGTDTVTPFVQGLAGLVHWGSNNFVIEFDGGADIRLNPKDKWCVRLEAGVPFVFETGGHSTGFQVGVGFSMNLGQK